MDRDNSAINALKRLERAGSEESKASAKLREAAATLAREILPLLPVETYLPRGYEKLRLGHEPAIDYLYLPPSEGGSDAMFGYLNADDAFGPWQQRPPTPSLALIHRFAHDVATGWLDELERFLLDRAAVSNLETDTIDRRRAKMAALGDNDD